MVQRQFCHRHPGFAQERGVVVSSGPHHLVLALLCPHMGRTDFSQLKMIEEAVPTGCVKPVAKPTRESLKTRVAELRVGLAEAEARLREIEEGERLEALVKARNLMRAFELTPEDLGLTPAPKRRGRPRKASS